MAETPLSHTVADAPRSLLAAEFDSFRVRIKISEVGRRLLFAAAVLLASLLVVVIADHTVPGGLAVPLIRALGLLVGLTAAVLLGWIAWIAIRRLNPLFVARGLERSRGVANNVILNWLLVQREPARLYAGDAAAAQAAMELAEPSGLRESEPRSLAPLFVLAAVGGAWLLFGVMTPKPILTSLQRMLGAAVDAPSATRIRLVSPAAGESLHVGEPAALLFMVEGRGAASLALELLADESPESPVILTRIGESVESPGAGALAGDDAGLRRVGLSANEVSRSVVFRARAGDAILRGTIPVLPRPDITALRVRLTPPSYVGAPESVVETPDFTVWTGTRAAFEFRANTEIRGPVFVLRGENETRTRMSVVGGARDGAAASLMLTDGGDYWFEFSDATGRPYPDPPPHRITVRVDQAPRISITEPEINPLAANARPIDATRVARLKATASDDVRLASVTLVVERDGRSPARRELLGGGAPPPDEAVTVEVATGDLGLQPGESAKVWFEAKDNRRLFDDSPAPRTSVTGAVVVVRPRLAPPIIPPKPKAAPAEGEPGENAAVGKRAKGTGEGDNGAAAGDGAGDGSGAGGEESGNSYSDSPEGKPADTGGEGGIPDPTANAGEAEQQTGKPSAATGGDMAGGQNENQEGGLGDGNGDGGGEGSGGGESPSFEDDLKRFVEDRGSDVNEAREALDRSSDREQSKPETRQPDAAEPSETPLPDGAPKPEAKADQPAPQPKPSGEPAEDAQPKDSDAPQESPQNHEPDNPPKAESQPAPPSDGAPPPKDETPSKPQKSDASPERDAESTNGNKSDTPADSSPGDQKPSEPEPAAKPEIAPSPDGKVEGENPPAPEPDLPEMNDPGARSASADAPEIPGGAPLPPDTPIPEDESVTPGERPGEHPKKVEEPAPGSDVQPRSELVNTLDLIERADELDEESLKDLPWPVEKKRAFLAELKRLAASAKRAGVATDLKRWRSRAALGDLSLQRGSGFEEGVRVHAGETALEADLLERAVPPAEQKISPGLRAALDAYYRSLAAKQSNDRK